MKPLVGIVVSLMLLMGSAYATGPGPARYTSLSFDVLCGFDYETHPAIPSRVRAYNGRLVQIAGFMLPFDYNPAGVHTFALLKDRSACCYGATPRMNDWILVEMADGGTVPVMKDTPLEVRGRLQVGAEKTGNDINGQVECLYRMRGDQVQALQ